MSDKAATIRVDKWLWHARLFKTRSLAAKQCAAGHVALNGEKVAKPARTVAPGDDLVVLQGNRRRFLRVVAIGARRGPAAEAQALYEETAEPERIGQPGSAFSDRPRGTGRPTKKDRRLIEALKRHTGYPGD